jgi:hypothetical protein
MAFRLPVNQDVHTSELTASCQQSAALRLQGETIPTMQTALFRGLAAHTVMEHIHLGVWSPIQVPAYIETAKQITIEKSKDEGRPMSDTVVRDMDEIGDDICKVAIHYIERQADYFSKCKVLGVEVPVRWRLEVEGLEPINFASHVDILYRDPNGELRIRDFKYQDQPPTMEYLARNKQMFVYHFCATEGIFKLHDLGSDADWVHFGELAWMEVVDLKNFKPYLKATPVTENGVVTTYSKGDQRPLRNLIKDWRYSPDKESDMKQQLAQQVSAMRSGYWPTNPDKRGCQLCEAKTSCMNAIKDENPYQE